MTYLKSLCTYFVLICFYSCAAQNEVTIETNKLSNTVYMLKGQGGNIGISIGEDGVFVIDDQFAPLTPKILQAIRQLSEKPIKYVANTHFHGDHTGGNANFQKAGATIIAHDNVRARLLLPKRDGSNNPKETLPVLTFNDQLSIYINDEKVSVFHVDNAHTDGDAVLYFSKSNVLHTGDTFFKDRYPYIDLNSGGSVDGYIAAVKRSLMLIDDKTKIIPGHGDLASKEDYESFLNMMKTLKSSILKEIENGKSEDDVASNTALTKTYDDLGYSWRFITSEKIRRTFYQSLKNQNTN